MTKTDAHQQTLLDVYRAMLAARQIDEASQELTHRGEAFFHVSPAGHEAVAALAPHLTADDWLHCHYRTANKSDTLESTPPETPITTRSKPR